MPETTRILAKDIVPFFHEIVPRLREIVPCQLKREKALEDKRVANEELKKLGEIPQSQNDLLKKLQEDYDNYIDELVSEIHAYEANRRNSYFAPLRGGNFWISFARERGRFGFIPEEIKDQVIQRIVGTQEGITDLERAKRKKTILKRIEVAEKEINENTFGNLSLPLHASDYQYAPDTFFDHWREKQVMVSEPVNAQGLHLDYCSDDEKWAYEQMGIGPCMSSKAVKLAYRP